MNSLITSHVTPIPPTFGNRLPTLKKTNSVFFQSAVKIDLHSPCASRRRRTCTGHVSTNKELQKQIKNQQISLGRICRHGWIELRSCEREMKTKGGNRVVPLKPVSL